MPKRSRFPRDAMLAMAVVAVILSAQTIQMNALLGAVTRPDAVGLAVPPPRDVPPPPPQGNMPQQPQGDMQEPPCLPGQAHVPPCPRAASVTDGGMPAPASAQHIDELLPDTSAGHRPIGTDGNAPASSGEDLSAIEAGLPIEGTVLPGEGSSTSEDRADPAFLAAENVRLRQQVASLEKRVADLEAQLKQLQPPPPPNGTVPPSSDNPSAPAAASSGPAVLTPTAPDAQPGAFARFLQLFGF